MGKYDNQFTDDDKAVSSQFKFEKIGDRVQGTYINKKTNVQTKYGSKTYHEIQNEEGVFMLWERKGFDEQIARCRLGQIIEVRCINIKDTGAGNPWIQLEVFSRPDLVDTEWLAQQKEGAEMENIVQGNQGGGAEQPASDEINVEGIPFDNPQTTNSPIAQATAQTPGNITGGATQPAPAGIQVTPTTSAPSPTTVTPATAPAPATDNKEEEIYAIAIEKLKIVDTDPLNIRKSIMEATGKAFIAPNMDIILEKLKAL